MSALLRAEFPAEPPRAATETAAGAVSGAAPTEYVIAASDIVGGHLCVCAGDALGPVVAGLFPRTRHGRRLAECAIRNLRVAAEAERILAEWRAAGSPPPRRPPSRYERMYAMAPEERRAWEDQQDYDEYRAEKGSP